MIIDDDGLILLVVIGGGGGSSISSGSVGGGMVGLFGINDYGVGDGGGRGGDSFLLTLQIYIKKG